MGSLSFGEILTIVVIILIIFGPNRLPEFARKIGEMMAWARKSMQDFTQSIQGELGDGMQPLSDLKREFDGARNDLTGAINSIVTSAPTQMPVPPETTEPPESTIDSNETDPEPNRGGEEPVDESSAPPGAEDTKPSEPERRSEDT